MHQEPATGGHQIRHCGDVLEVSLHLPQAMDGRGWLRTNLGSGEVRRREIIGFARRHDSILHRDWHDIPMTRVNERQFRLRLPLVEVGRFEAKAFFLEPGSNEPIWTRGDNAVIKVEPADTVCANTLYTAFVRQFGPNRGRETETEGTRAAVSLLEQGGYAVIPRSGTFRDLIGQLDLVLGTMGFRILQLLPIHPVPTTYARMGRFGSPFAALDYWSVDPALAEFDRRTTPLQQFEELIDAVHARGAKLFMDMPINHTGWASQLQLHHPEWFARNADATFTSPGAWGVTWEDLSKLDYQHRELWWHMAEVFLHWCRQGVDGFRCDAGYMIPAPVWEYLVAEVRTQFPDTIFLLEGLGGPAATVDSLLTSSNLNWAYSELFQNEHRPEVESAVTEAARMAASRGLLVHYAETHDNNRLAARSPTWADMRTALSALCAPAGGFGVTNGVEWHATEKVDVHGAAPLAWGNPDNQVARLRRLNTLLQHHPAFFAGARLEPAPGSGPAFVLRREGADRAGSVLVAINLDDVHPCTAVWPASLFPVAGPVVDLLGGKAVPIHQHDGACSHRLAPGEALCLSPDADWVLRLETGGGGAEPARALLQRRRAKVLELHRALHGFGDVSDVDVGSLADLLAADPLAMVAACGGAGAPRVVAWTWPQDARRMVPVPPGHALLLRAPEDFAVELRVGGRSEHRERSLPTADGQFVVLIPPRPEPAEPEAGVLALTVFERAAVRRLEAPLLLLAPVERALVRARFGSEEAERVGAYAIAANTIGAVAQVRAAWGTVRSQYDVLLAANLHPDFPVDRRMLLTRCRAWLVFRGYSHPLDEHCLESFAQEDDGAVVSRFAVPSGLGKLVSLEVTLRLATDRNAVDITFRRLSARTRDELAADCPVRLILRPDVEDRGMHEKTKAYQGSEHAFPSAVRGLGDGFIFTPAPDRPLHVHLSGGAFMQAPEWTYMVWHPEEAERGLDANSDLFSPGYFTVDLQAGEAAVLGAAVGARVEDPAPPSAERPSVGGAAAHGRALPLGLAMLHSMQAFVVKRGEGKTVIAGYPWFLDWGRDTMICLRGLVAAGRVKECKAILKEFARFESGGTLPNLIHGADAMNRDTSDAPLWFFTACADVCRAEGHHRFLGQDVGGRTVLAVLQSIAGGYLRGTSNGIRMDAESGLIFSPPHFTWMDTNFPAGTPREGYPIEIQALWHAALSLLAAHDRPGPWAALAGQVGASILRCYPRTGGVGLTRGRYLSDCLHARAGQSAAQARPDDALRPNQLLALTLGAVTETGLAGDVLTACAELLVPGAIRSLADRPVEQPLPILLDGHLLNDPYRPYCGRYEGDEDTRRKPAYHNGTAWTWLFPSYSEALFRVFGEPVRATAAALLGSAATIVNRDVIRQVPEILDGDAPHRGRGCGAQAWGCTELYRVLALLGALP